MKSTAKYPYLLLFVLQLAGHVMAVPTAEEIQTFLKNRPEIDEISWKDPARGAPLKVRIMSANAQGVTVEKQLPASLTVRTLPFNELSGIRITLTAAEESLLKDPQPDAVPAMRVLWEARKFVIGPEYSGVTETGVAFAKALRRSGKPEAYEEAQKVLTHIYSREGPGYPKAMAAAEQDTLGFVRLLKSGKPADIEKRAWEITEKAPVDNPEIMLMTTTVLANSQYEQLRSLEEENPRWQEDQEVLPMRQKLYNMALDFALYPSLFAADHASEASAGLAKVARIYQFTGENERLKGALEDLAALYPESAEAKEYAPLLAKLIEAATANRLAQVKTEPPAPEEKKTEPADTTSPTDPNTPRRYNLFGD